MAAASTFSYAQAAKGQGSGPAQATLTSQNSQAENTLASTTATPVAEEQLDAADGLQQSSKMDAPSAGLEKLDVESAFGTDNDVKPEPVQEKRPDSKREDESSRLDRPWRRNDKSTRSSSTATRSVDEHDSRRSRKGKKGKTSDAQNGDGSVTEQDAKEEPEPPKIELAEAPLPSVNIWQQRKEAQQAKTKPEPTTNGISGDTQEETTGTQAEPANDTNVVPVHLNGTSKPAPKNVEKPERNGSRGNRLAGRDSKDGKSEIPPPVDDAVSWPTPETAIQEDKKKTTEKPERSEKENPEDAAQGKSRQKKEWVTYDYVPSVSFETQLPQMRGSKPRGGAKGANISRSAGSTQSSEKAAATASNKPTETRDRPREGPNGASRTTSLPPASKRASVDASNVRGEPRKPAHHAEKAKDAASGQQDQQQFGREARSERGRGGYRGRGGHHAVNPHTQHQHSASSMAAPSFPAANSLPTRSQGPYSPPPRQSHGQMYMPPPQRGGRGGRNGGGNYHRMSLPNGASRLAAVQTQFAPYDYPMPPMSAMPFQQAPYWDNMMIPMLRNQLEYYFSIENLCKDMYLRQRMDSQGFVPLMFIAAFKRMRELSPDTSLIRSVCEESHEIDYVVGDDDCERLRRRHGWENFVLPMEDRDELARNHGPAQVTWKNRSFTYAPQYNGPAPTPYGATSPQSYQNQPNPGSFSEEHQAVQGVNGLVNGSGAGTQLSAEVPDFSPGESNGTAKSVNGVNGITNGAHSHDAGQL